MRTSKFSRNYSSKPYSKLKIYLLYLWLIPGVPIITFMAAFIIGANKHRDNNTLLDLMDYSADYTLPLLAFIGFLSWMWTVQALSQSLFVKTEKGIRINATGFAKNEFSFASVSEISVYRLFPFGSLINIKSPIGTNVRMFAILANVDTLKLQRFIGDNIIVKS